MGFKGKKKRDNEELNNGEIDDNNAKPSTSTFKKEKILPSMIKNKEKRSEIHSKLKHEKKLEKRRKLKDRAAADKRALELGEEVRFALLCLLSLSSSYSFDLDLNWMAEVYDVFCFGGVASAEAGSAYDWEY